MSFINNPGGVLNRVRSSHSDYSDESWQEPLEVEEQVIHQWVERPQVRRMVTLGEGEGSKGSNNF